MIDFGYHIAANGHNVDALIGLSSDELTQLIAGLVSLQATKHEDEKALAALRLALVKVRQRLEGR